MGKFTKTFTCEHTGIKTIYTYQDSIVHGIQSVEIEYPKDYLKDLEKAEKRNNNLPKTRQTYTNPANGREISYARAKFLGLVE